MNRIDLTICNQRNVVFFCFLGVMVGVCNWSLATEQKRLPDPLADAEHPVHVQRKLKLEASLPKVPKTMMVYRVDRPKVDMQWVKSMARDLLGSTNVVKLKRTVYVVDGMLDGERFSLEVDKKTGFCTLENREFYAIDSAVREDGSFPNPEQTKAIAEKFLKKHNLMPEDAFFRRVVDNTKGADVMSIGFGRRVDNTDFWGAGSEIIMNIGRNGRIARVRVAWPKLQPSEMYSIISPEKAVQKMNQGEGVLYHGQSGVIKGVKLVYYASPLVQDYVQPCYYLSCEDKESKNKGHFYGVLKAIAQE